MYLPLCALPLPPSRGHCGQAASQDLWHQYKSISLSLSLSPLLVANWLKPQSLKSLKSSNNLVNVVCCLPNVGFKFTAIFEAVEEVFPAHLFDTSSWSLKHFPAPTWDSFASATVATTENHNYTDSCTNESYQIRRSAVLVLPTMDSHKCILKARKIAFTTIVNKCGNISNSWQHMQNQKRKWLS